MSKGHYPYPEDEFDVPVDPDGPHGVHRAPRSARSRWTPFVVVIIVVPLLTFGAVYYLSRGGSISDLWDKATSAAQSDEDTDTTADDGTDTTDTTDDTADDTATDAASEEPSTPPAPEPVMSTPVVVLNAAGIQGLAATAQSSLTNAGFTAVTVDNTTKGKLTESTVYYGTADLEPTAQLVAEKLGLTAVQLDASAASGVRVVLIEKLAS